MDTLILFEGDIKMSDNQNNEEDQIVNDVINDLVERKNYTQEFAERQVYLSYF